MDTSFRLLPQQASDHAASVDRLTIALLLVTVFFTLLIAMLVIFFAIKYRRRPAAPSALREAPKGGHSRGPLILEITWTVIPFILVTLMFLAGAKIFVRAQQPPPDAMAINVIGKQWMWQVQHPSGAREINALHVPAGKPIRLLMISEDVIHDFGLPAFRMKQDVLPGHYTSEWFEPTVAGEYHLFCDQYCGAEHSKMVGIVHVMEPAKYLQWLEGRAADVPPRVSGERLFSQYGCATCHAARGPTMAGLYGRKVDLEGGASVIADENYLRESILYPSAKITRGYPPIMPSFRGQLTEAQVMDLVTYIKSLAGSTSEPYMLQNVGPTTQPSRVIPGPFEHQPSPKEQP